jgi:hypothetical protein
MFTKKPFLFLFLLISVTFIFSLNLFYLSKNKKGQPSSSLPTPSQNILFFTSPINNLSAKVEKVEGDTIIVSREFFYQPLAPELLMAAPPEAANPTPFPTPYRQKLTFKIKTTGKTSLEREGFFVPLFFQKSQTPKITLDEIKPGDNLNIFFQEDLRVVNDNHLTATRIVLPPITHQLTGKISKIEGDKIQIEATEMPPMPLPPEETSQPQKLFTFLTDDKTEVSYQKKVQEKMPGGEMMMETLKPVKQTLSDLKVGDRVRVYSFEDILKTQNPKAVRIEPVRE